MKATVENNVLIIEIPLNTPRPSSSGKTLIVASTSGFMISTAEVDGKNVSISVNATIPK